MKKITKQVEVVQYLCNICEHPYTTEYGAEDCEARHLQETCPHDEVRYVLDFDKSRGYEGECECEVFLEKRCNECDYEVDRVELKEYEPSQIVLEKLYDVLKNWVEK